jgi:hypothetical protein
LAAEAVLTTSLKWHVWSDMSACWYVSMSTYQHGSMSTCLKWHVSMLVCQHVHISAWQHVHISACQHVGMSACWYVSMSVNQQVGMSALWHVWKVKLSQFFHDLDMLYHSGLVGKSCFLERDYIGLLCSIETFPSMPCYQL